MRARFIALLLIVHLPSAAAAQHVPTVDDLLNVTTAGGAHISPDGKWVAYTVSEADFKQNAFITQGSGPERRYCSRRCATRERVAAHRRSHSAEHSSEIK